MVEWSVRPYMAGDEEQLAALFAQVFGRSRSVEAWRWKLKGWHAPFETVWVAVTADEQIVGQYGGIPLRVKFGEQVYPAVHAVEAMSARRYRRQGMLTKLGSAAHDAWKEAGQIAVLGLPNNQWGTRNTALGYRHVFPLVWLRYPLRLDRVATRTTKVPRILTGPAMVLGKAASYLWRQTSQSRVRTGGSQVQIEQVHASSTMFDELWSAASREYGNLIVRDSAWVEWRYLRAVDLHYKVFLACIGGAPYGYIAYRLAGAGDHVNGYIADLFVRRGADAVADVLLKAALDDMSAACAGMVLSAVAPRSALYFRMRRFGFLKGSAQFSFEIVPLQATFDLGSLADSSCWHLTAGDFDIDLA
jgi:hypothetical protein